MKRAMLILVGLAMIFVLMTEADAQRRFGVRGPRGRRGLVDVRGRNIHRGHSRLAFSLRFGTSVYRPNGYSYHRPVYQPYNYYPYHHQTYRPPVVVQPVTPRYLSAAPCGHTTLCQCAHPRSAGYWLYLRVRDRDGYLRFRWVWAAQ